MASRSRSKSVRGAAGVAVLVGVVAAVWGAVGSLAPFFVYNGTTVYSAARPVALLAVIGVMLAALALPVVAIVLATRVLRNYGTDRVARMLALVALVLGLVGAVAAISGSLPIIVEVVLTF